MDTDEKVEREASAPPAEESAVEESEESACQRRGVSCGACCGIFNLELDSAGRRRLLTERTRRFARVDFQNNEDFVSYRQVREEAEAAFARRDPEIYVCPFYGYLEEKPSPEEQPAEEQSAEEKGSAEDIEGEFNLNKTGCLAHPSRTGRPDSQNFSLYGASICLSYDCPNKERDALRKSQGRGDWTWSAFLARHFPGQEEYSRLMGDGLFLEALAKVGVLEHPARTRALLALCRARLYHPDSQAITSFSIKFRYFEDVADEILSYTDSSGARAAGYGKERLLELIEILLACPVGDGTQTNDSQGSPGNTAKADGR